MSLPEGSTPIASRLRHYTPALAGMSLALFDARSQSSVRFRAGPATGVEARGTTKAVRLRIDTAQGELSLHVDVSGHAALQAIALEADAQRRVALTGLWLAGPLGALSAQGIAQASVQDISFDAHPHGETSGAGALHFEYEHAGFVHTAALLEAPPALAAALERRAVSSAHNMLRGAAHAALPDALAGLAVPTRVRLRTRRCSTALLASLRAGDVLLGWPRASGYAHGGSLDHVSLLWGAQAGRVIGAQARINTRNVILESIPRIMSHDLEFSLPTPAQESSAAAAGRPVDLSEVELPIHIELVTINLTLAQIAGLQPGYLLSLPLALADAEIRLIAHGQTLALGELVAVGDNLGLQIHHIAKSDERHT